MSACARRTWASWHRDRRHPTRLDLAPDFWVYLTRAVAIAVYVVAPKTAFTFDAFGAVLGLTWLSTVPPTAGLVSKLFGTRYLATLFGLTLLSHQIGGFFGAWLGGLAVVSSGSYPRVTRGCGGPTWPWRCVLRLLICRCGSARRIDKPRRPRGRRLLGSA